MNEQRPPEDQPDATGDAATASSEAPHSYPNLDRLGGVLSDSAQQRQADQSDGAKSAMSEKMAPYPARELFGPRRPLDTLELELMLAVRNATGTFNALERASDRGAVPSDDVVKAHYAAAAEVQAARTRLAQEYRDLGYTGTGPNFELAVVRAELRDLSWLVRDLVYSLRPPADAGPATNAAVFTGLGGDAGPTVQQVTIGHYPTATELPNAIPLGGDDPAALEAQAAGAQQESNDAAAARQTYDATRGGDPGVDGGMA